MTFPLPLRDFRWMSQEEIDRFDPMRDVSEKTGPGYILEVDLEYPSNLHFPHNDYPLAPEKMDITEDMLSPYSLLCKKIIYGEKARPIPNKLTSTFNSRKNYLIHGLNLQLCLRLGLKLKKIHRIITFHQEPFIAPYIHYCTRKRKEAKTETERTFWKLIINSLYGKMIEGWKNRMDCHFNYSREQASKRASSPYYIGAVPLTNDCSMTFSRQKRIQLNKQQWAIGFSILEISKLVMQRLYYDTIQPRFGVENTELLMTDTDSFLMKITSKLSRTECMRMLEDVMDFSNYPPSHPLFSEKRAKELGYLKNEIPVGRITSFVGLKSKTYGITVDGKSEVIKAKGIPSYTKRTIPVSSMMDCLHRIRDYQAEFNQIRSVDHVITLVHSKRLAFSSFDDKRYLLCPQHSVPYGSCLIPHKGNKCVFCDAIRERFAKFTLSSNPPLYSPVTEWKHQLK